MRIKEKFEKRINALFQEGAISTQQQWDDILTRCYQNVEPFKVIGKVGYFYDERR